MVIRCGLVNNLGEEICQEGFFMYEGHCFPLPDAADMCPEGFVLVSLDGETVEAVCMPDCSLSSNCSEFCSDPFWDPVLQGCVCDDGEEVSFCGCPYPLEESIVVAGVVDGSGFCELPLQNCYNLGIEINVEPFVCDGPLPELDTIKIIVKPLNEENFTPFVDAITIEDLENCELLNGTQELVDIIGLYDGGNNQDRAAFVADAAGCIEIQFTRDPSLPTNITFLGDMNQNITIPVCPRAFDPCSCRPENIVDSEGIVEYWYDELTFTGNSNTEITVASNNIPEGFLDPNGLAPYTGTIGITDGEGFLTIPFYRTPGFDTDVDLQDERTQIANLSSTCTLPVDACIAIVPTLGEWSIVALGLLMMIFSVIALRTKSSTTSISQ